MKRHPRPVTRPRAAKQAAETPLRMEALSWPTEPEPMPVNTAKELEGKPFGSLYIGWWCNAHCLDSLSAHNAVGQGCCSTVYHSTWSTTKTNCQGTGRFYATKKDALLALRWEYCRKVAKFLMWIDDQMLP